MSFFVIVFLFVMFLVIRSAIKGGRSGGSHHSHSSNDPTNMWGGDQQRSLDSSNTDFGTHDSESHTHHHHQGHHDHGHHGGHHGGHDSGGYGGGDAGGGGHH
jgi:hypothetical protein